MYFIEASTSVEQLPIQKTFLGASISWKQSLYLIVLRNQFHNIILEKTFH